MATFSYRLEESEEYPWHASMDVAGCNGGGGFWSFVGLTGVCVCMSRRCGIMGSGLLKEVVSFKLARKTHLNMLNEV